MMGLIKRIIKGINRAAVGRDPRMGKLREIMERTSTTTSPEELFHDVSDDFWFWLHTEGYRKSAKLRSILPGLPSEALQIHYTGAAGDVTLREAFSAYLLFRQITEKQLEGPLNTILDFGCGWGRTIRFFLKDVKPSKLWGIDPAREVIEICRQTNKWCNFELIDPYPPTSLPDDTFDLIYCYSVFSHLSEEIHQKWLIEFGRLLRPGGLLIATTRPREFILMCAELRKEKSRPYWKEGPAKSFLDTEQALSDYDKGKYLYSPAKEGSFFGNTCIPRGYVVDHWTEHFTFIDYINDRNACIQNVIVVKASP